jgi:oxepin-CoA hydrolase/3-oxo-5,6-dehydrosuberyl-CoA semialdehyde dehydrogenase
MAALRSYVSGQWQEPTESGAPLHDAVTGEVVATVSSAGVDMAAALDYGRTVGGPALRELTFHQRAALLKALASQLREHREELYALSARTGATLGDSKFDVDGGIGVLFAYSSKGKRELPNDTVYVEGAVELLHRARPDDRGGHGGVREHPGHRHLRHRQAPPSGSSFRVSL